MKIAAAISAGRPGFSVCRRSNWSLNTPSAVSAAISVSTAPTVAIALMTTSFIKAIATVGAVLTLMAALTALGVFKLQFDRRQTEKPGLPALIAAAIFIGLSGLMLFYE